MSDATPMTASTPTTLPAWLAAQARQRPDSVALRHKSLGVWHVRNWVQVSAEVLSLADALRRRGFGVGAVLVILSRPRPEALFAALAAQWLGGVAALFDPLDDEPSQLGPLRETDADFALAEGVDEIARLRASGLRPVLLCYADGRGLVGMPERGDTLGHALVDYADLLASSPPMRADHNVSPQARDDAEAFAFYRQGEQSVEQQHITHAELLAEGARLVRTEQLEADEEALAARAFAASGQARYLLAPWLIAGFRLNFPERLETRDSDRRELGPTLVLGTRETWGRLHAQMQQRLPLPGTLRRRLVAWALAPTPGPLNRLLGHWLVRRPLRDVLGLSRTRVPLLVGAPLQTEAQALFAALGVDVRNWPAPERWFAARQPAASGWIASRPQTV